MKIDDIYIGSRYEYINECPCCGLVQKILTQKDKDPEYHTEIYLQCQCGEYLEFILPVN